MVNDLDGGDQRHEDGQLDLSPAVGPIYYRVVEDIFSDPEDTDRAVDVVIQTTDPEDFAEFDDAVEEAMDRIQERIDLEEMAERPDRAHLDLLEEKLGDTGEALGEDWEAYCSSLSQPTVLMDGEEINLAEVGGRERFARLVRLGCSFSEQQVETFEELTRQAECGVGATRVKPKCLTPRPRPQLELSRVKIDPALAAAYDPSLIRGLLGRYKQLYESHHDRKPHRSGFVGDFARPETPESYIRILTVFHGEAGCITFAVAVPLGQLPPNGAVMDRATIWLDGRTSPEMN